MNGQRRPCFLCAGDDSQLRRSLRPGECHFCEGKSNLVERDQLTGLIWESQECPACRNTGQCYRCLGKGSILQDPRLLSHGPRAFLSRTLRDENWDDFIAKYTTNEQDTFYLKSIVTKASRRLSRKRLALIVDRDVIVLNSIIMTIRASGYPMIEYNNLVSILVQKYGQWKEKENPIAALDEVSLIEVKVIHDECVPYLAVGESGDKATHDLTVIIDFVKSKERRIFSELPRDSF